MSSHPAVSVEGVRKRFGTTDALVGVDLRVEEGEVVGLLGPNGAGKTTLVRVLATLLAPDEGRASIFGIDVVDEADAVRRSIGLTGQYAAVDEILTGRENLRMFGELFHLSGRDARRRADELLERFSLSEAADRPARTYSGGMRRRLDLASSLLVRPRLLFLDEPTTGLDPRSRNAIWDVTRELVAEGTTLLLTTQYLEEADQLADRIAVIDHGQIIAEGTGDELKDHVGGQVVDVNFAEVADSERACELIAGAERTANPRQVRIAVGADDALGELARVAARLQEAGLLVRDLGLRRPTLDDVFLELTDNAP
ncbi:MAG: ATP-binding cassette domain-containing protein, partial [Nitriliruptoraceae bacterium]